jgi:hypothetical protein
MKHPVVRGYLAPIEQQCWLRKDIAHVEFHFALNNQVQHKMQVVVDERGSRVGKHLLPIGNTKCYLISLAN